MRSEGGRGVLMGGVPGAPGAHVVVIGAGVSGANAIAIAVGMGARVTVLDLDVDKLRALDDRYHGRVHTVYSTALALEQAVLDADLVIGAVLVPGARAPRLVSHELVSRMQPGAVLVDMGLPLSGAAGAPGAAGASGRRAVGRGRRAGTQTARTQTARIT